MPLCLIKYHVMTSWRHERVEVYLHTFLTSTKEVDMKWNGRSALHLERCDSRLGTETDFLFFDAVS